MAVASETQTPPDQDPYMTENIPDQNKNTKDFINWWQERIQSWRSHCKERYEIMIEDQRFRRGLQWDGQKTIKDDRYVVNEVQSEIAASVATLYAKNPTFSARRKPGLDFAIWDEIPSTYENAVKIAQDAALTGMSPPPDVLALLQDISNGQKRRAELDRFGKTLELLFANQLRNQFPDFKQEMKQFIDRVECSGVAYIKLGYVRAGEVSPEAAGRLADMASRVSYLQALAVSTQDKTQSENYKREIEEINIAVKTLQESNYIITREGLDFKFPRATALIIDPVCTQLRGFVGARAVAEEYYMASCTIQQIYGKKVSGKASSYARKRVSEQDDYSYTKISGDKNRQADYDDYYRVWEIYHKETGSVFTICEGYDEYLREPAALDVIVEQFYPYYPLHFNRCEDDVSIFPESTCRNIRHQQKELNRQTEALRQHRINSKPQYGAAAGVLSDQDKDNLEGAPAFAVIEFQNMQAGQKSEDVFGQIKKQPIDPNMYDRNGTREDMRRITRRSDAALGAASRATATADSIGEQSRQVEDQSKADDLDDLLSLVARDAGAILVMNMPTDKVKEIVGPGAFWPSVDPGAMLADIYLDVEAGSSGRRNKVMEVANLQRLVPLLVQIPGIRPDWLARTAIKLADTSIDFSEAYLEGIPSITALNSMLQKTAMQAATGNPATDPNMQGDQGGDKTPRAPEPDMSMTVNPGMNDIPSTLNS